MEEYTLASTEASNEYMGEQEPMGFMAIEGGFHDGIFLTGGIRKNPHFPSRIARTISTGRPPQYT